MVSWDLAFLLSSGNDHDSRHAVPLLSQIDIEGSNILGDKPMGPKQYGTTSIHRMLSIRFRPRATSATRGLWTGTLTRNTIWLNASFRNSNGFEKYLRAMINLTPRS